MASKISQTGVVIYADGTGYYVRKTDEVQKKLTAGQNITIDSNNVISAIVDLTDYYNKAEVNQLLADLDSISMRVVTTLPTTGVSNIIYLVQRTGETVYDQWVYSEGQWYHIGDTNIDLSEYYTKLEADAKFQEILSEGNNIDPVTDSTELSSVDLSNKVVDKVAVSDLWDYMWKKIYPVGSIYTTVTNDDPATLFGGTWEIVGANRVLWGVGSGDTAGGTLAQQLPNIKGTLDFSPGSQGHTEVSVGGAFYKTANWSGTYPMPVDGSSSSGTRKVGFDANKSSSVYTDNGIVRPNAYTVKWWKRTA